MNLAVAENLTQLRGLPTHFSFDNGNKPLLSNVVPSAFIIPEISTRNNSVKFNLKDFDYGFDLDLVDFDWEEFSPIAQLKLKLTDDVFVKLVLTGIWEKQENQAEPVFQLNDVGVDLENKSEIPLSNFVAVTFWAMLGLSKNCSVSIQSIKYNFNLAFDIPVNKISDLLQERQLAYRLLVIEKALKISLPFPRRPIDGLEVENISFSYHVIIEKEFNWLCNKLTFFPTATSENQNLLPKTDSTFPLVFPTLNEERLVFGQLINLGRFMIEVNQAKVTNYSEAKEELLKFDGKQVKVIIKSVDGIMRYNSTASPALPKNAFSKDIQKLIDLESNLIDAVFEKHVNSYSNAFEGLSDQQIEVLTERPILEEEAFNF
jgi:hypothetical protein